MRRKNDRKESIWLALAVGRGRRGFSLVTVAAVGAVTMMWLFAMSAAVLPMYQRASQGKYLTVLRSAAEAGLDYTIAQLNQAITTGNPTPVDDTSNDGTPTVSAVPETVLGNTGATVSVAVNNIGPPTTSSIYDQSWGGGANQWRVVTSTANYAGLQRSIRVILKPEPGASIPTSTQVPYFAFAMFGRSLVTLSGNANSDGYDSRTGAYGGSNVNDYAGDVGSNTYVELNGNSVVGGDLRVYSQPVASPVAVSARSNSSNARVNDQLITNGISDGFTGTDGPLPLLGDNVLAQGQGTPTRTGDYTTPIDSSQSYSPMEIPPAKSVPPGAPVVTGSIDWSSGNEGYVSQPAPGQVVDMGSTIVVTGNKTLYVRPGDYKISSLSVGGNGSVQILPNLDGSPGQVRFFVEGNTAGSNVIQIAGNGIVNPAAVPKPGNLQFWYNGNKAIKVSGNGALHSVIYAPNAPIEIAGNGAMHGSVVGGTVDNHGNGGVHFDQALLDTSGTSGLTYTSNTATTAPSGLKARSWQEL